MTILPQINLKVGRTYRMFSGRKVPVKFEQIITSPEGAFDTFSLFRERADSEETWSVHGEHSSGNPDLRLVFEEDLDDAPAVPVAVPAPTAPAVVVGEVPASRPGGLGYLVITTTVDLETMTSRTSVSKVF